MEDTNVWPICQKLFYNGNELHENDTIETIHFLNSDEIRLIELEQEDEHLGKTVNGRDEGFGGTALQGNHGRSCPDCTFMNPPGVAMCEVCTRPFIIEVL
jgi:hypothetical protein